MPSLHFFADDSLNQFYQKTNLSYTNPDTEEIIALLISPSNPYYNDNRMINLANSKLIYTLGYNDFVDTFDFSELAFLQVNLGTRTKSGKMLHDSTFEELLESTMPLYHATFLNQLVKQCSKLHKLMINVKGDLSVHEKPLSILLDGLNCIDSLIINYETPFVSGEKVNDIIFSTAFDNVRFLALSGEGWTQFPKQISNKKKIALKELIIYNTLLINLDGISNLDSLEGLSILSSRSDQVFDFFEAYRCTSLKTVTISSTTIDSIGSGILNLINLQEIELVNNFQLSYLDRRIFCLSNLKKFSLETHYLRLRSWEPGLKRLVKRLYKDVIKKKEPCLSDWNMHPWFSLVSIIITK